MKIMQRCPYKTHSYYNHSSYETKSIKWSRIPDGVITFRTANGSKMSGLSCNGLTIKANDMTSFKADGDSRSGLCGGGSTFKEGDGS